MIIPVLTEKHVYKNGKQYFRTDRLGDISDSELVWMCRSIQICSKVGNKWIAKVRVASHLIGAVMLGVMGAFCLIKYSRHLIADGSITTMALMVMLFFQ